MPKTARQLAWEDEQLKETTFLVTDPEAQSGLTKALPPGAELVRIVNVYEADGWPERKVWCVKCRAHRHKHGFTAEISNGALVTTGSTCGAELFGTSWREQTKAFRARRQRREALLWADRARAGLPAVIEALVCWEKPVRAAADGRRRLDVAFPAVAEQLRASDDGALVAYERIEEARTDDDLGWREVPMGRVGGTSFLAAIPRLDAQFDAALRGLKTAYRELVSGKHLSDSDLRRLRSRAGRKPLLTLSRQYAEAQKLFSGTAFGQIVTWANRTVLTDGDVRYQAGQMIGESGQIFHLPELLALTTEPLDLIAKVVTASD